MKTKKIDENGKEKPKEKTQECRASERTTTECTSDHASQNGRDIAMTIRHPS